MYLSTWSLHRLLFNETLTLRQVPALARALGFEGVELEDIFFESTKPSYLRLLKDVLRKERCKVLIAISNDFTVQRKREYIKQLHHTHDFLKIGKQFDSPIVRILMGSKHPNVDALGQVIAGFTKLTPIAKQLKLKLAIENHDRLSNNPQVMMQALQTVGTQRFGICLDTGNLKPASRYRALQTLAPYAIMLHVKGYSFQRSGEEANINYRRCFKILRAANFSGPFVIEYDGSGDQVDGSIKTKALVQRYASHS